MPDNNMGSLNKLEDTWKRFGSLINSGLILVAALSVFVKAGGYMERIENEIRENKNEIAFVRTEAVKKWEDHNNYHNTRLGETKERDGNINQRLSGYDSEIRGLTTTVKELSYQSATQEKTLTTLTDSVKNIASNQSDMSGDMKVIREVLQRIDVQLKAPR